MIRHLGLILFALAAFPAAGAPVLDQPIDCTLGDTCYIQNYVDSDPSSGWSDFACGRLSYDGHKGTDFALPTHRNMEDGVDVLAAAAGTVKGTRDGMADVAVTAETLTSVKGRECGNGVVVDHGDGWVSQYCHMKQGSIAVQQGQKVKAGDRLGHVGLSGRTQFPHLHITLRHNGKVIDPFAPSGVDPACNAAPQETLWKNAPSYVAGGILQLGFDTKVPAYADVKSGTVGADVLPADIPALVLFVQGFGRNAGDRIQFSITGPNGFSFAHEAVLDDPKVMYMQAAGKKRRTATWSTGEYLGTVTLLRNGKPYDQRQHVLTIE